MLFFCDLLMTRCPACCSRGRADEQLLAPRKLRANEGVIRELLPQLSERGDVVLVLDNSHSKFRGRVIGFGSQIHRPKSPPVLAALPVKVDAVSAVTAVTAGAGVEMAAESTDDDDDDEFHDALEPRAPSRPLPVLFMPFPAGPAVILPYMS